ncbi:MAG TPA: hypothetical protein VIY28_11580 [Pseudonocardiaceae bacterium]
MDRLRCAAFDVALRGYDKRQVDGRLHFLGSELAAAENALWAAQARVATLEVTVNQERSRSDRGSPTVGSNFGERVEEILVLAEEEAREIRGQAHAAARDLVDQAKSQAGQVREAAAREADQTREAAAREAGQVREAAARAVVQIRQQAAREADQMCKAARAEAAQVVAQARLEADRLFTAATEAAEQRDQVSMQELQRLSGLQDAITADLYRAKNVLDSLFAAPATNGAQDSHSARTVNGRTP